MFEFLRQLLGLAPQLSVLTPVEIETERAQRAAKRARNHPVGPPYYCAACHTDLEQVQRAVYTRTSRFAPKIYWCARCIPSEMLPTAFEHVYDKFDDVSRELADAQKELERASKRVAYMQEKINALEAANGMCEACEEKRTPCFGCFTRPAMIACIPCGHCVACDDECSVRLFKDLEPDAAKRCPTCMQPATLQKLFL